MSIKIIKPGICSTIQDVGRFGYRHLGIGPGGAMDFFAASIANFLVGNNEEQPLIEMHFPAAEILFLEDALIGIAGADFDAHINNEAVKMYRPLFIKKNDTLSFKQNISGARVYLSIFGKIKIEKWLDSFSTHLKVQAGGFNGRLLQKGDTIRFEENSLPKLKNNFFISPDLLNVVYADSNIIHIIQGPEWGMADADFENLFLNSSFTISNQSDRMGYRLQGPTLSFKNPVELISSPVAYGTVQCLPNGQLIILMADHQTTGGYPRVAAVTKADLLKLAQATPGSNIHFKNVSLQQAEESLFLMEKNRTAIKKSCQIMYDNNRY